ncbi:hypothetical protein ACFOY4_39525 [Actinomadura syzygii]|uniref:Extensin n=1 Tax=Actinomadura syzygii TaxID=1427538 RepID=A0A5D0U9R3_9ACTN|nr:hypothetical protein [Actinomadura syzygii]TYC14456.1 hypothetical protein FXF65_16520 [Actinomadura syzygii]
MPVARPAASFDTALAWEVAGPASRPPSAALPVQRKMAPPTPPPPPQKQQATEPAAAPPKRSPPAPVARTAASAPIQRRTQTAGTSGTQRKAERQPEIDLDELARRLIGPLTRLLRAELRLDRERVGRLRDPRTY